MRTVYELGLSRVFLPEFDRMMETPQITKHHCYSVGEHTIHAMQEVQQDRILRLTMLLHDVAKPVCERQMKKGRIILKDIRRKVRKWHGLFCGG